MKIRFLGANGNVTGSRHFVEHENFRFLVDCGMVQEREYLGRNWEVNPEDPSTINAIFLTHAHLDHCGLIPKLVKDGFHGKIYGTSATLDLARLILLDAAHIQEEDALYKQKRHMKENRKGPHPVVPLFTKEDAEKVFPMFRPVSYCKPVEAGPGVECTFYDAGHVLGSSFIEIVLKKKDHRDKRLLFSGDLGRAGRPILEDPSFFDMSDRPVDALVIESTYGDRQSKPVEDVNDQLSEAIKRTIDRGGKVIMPVFAVERAQEVLYRLHILVEEGRIPSNIPIYLDSPMAVEATMIFKNHSECFDKDAFERYQRGEKLEGLHLLRTPDESRTLNTMGGPAIIMSSAGMCNAGRIKHHLANHIGNKKNMILFLGYQAYGTLGRQIVGGAKAVRIFGEMRKVKAEIESVQGISGHADQKELLEWFSAISPPPKEVFVVHGEEKAARTLANAIKRRAPESEVIVPKYGDSYTI